MKTAQMKKSNKLVIYFSVLLFLVLLITYSNHFDNGFHFDDEHTIVENVHIRTLQNIPEFFTNPKMFSSKSDHWGLRPLVTTTLAIDYWFGGGLNPFYFHLSMFIWFVILCALLYAIYNHLFKLTIPHRWNAFFALGAAAWYAFHPANAETVNYIISRSDVLSTLFAVLSFAIYAFYPAKRKYYLYIVPAVIGVFAKETLAVMVPVLFFYNLLFEKKLSVADIFKAKNFKTVLGIIVTLLPLFIAIVVVQLYTFSKMPESPTGFSNPFLNYVLTQSYVWAYYFVTFFFPLHLSADTDWTVITSFSDSRIVIGLLFVSALIVTIFKTSRKVETRGIAFGLIWFVFALLPTSIAPLAEVMNDHRMFFPFVGLSFSVVSFIALILTKYELGQVKNKFKPASLLVMMLVVLLTYAYGTRQRNKVWHDEESLWKDVTVKSPKNGRGLMNYGVIKMGNGQLDTAQAYFERAHLYLPNYYLLEVNLGILLDAKGNVKRAEEHFKKAITDMPGVYEPYYYYSNFLVSKNRYLEAKKMSEKANELSPYVVPNKLLLMKIYEKLEMWDQLQTVANETLKFTPGDKQALYYLNSSKKRETEIDRLIIETTNHPTPERFLNLSLEFYNRKQFQKCIEACNEALKLRPNYAEAYSNICAAYNNLKEWNKAIEACNKSLAINPNSRLAQNNLKWAQNQKK